jgi:hypothetical protein
MKGATRKRIEYVEANLTNINVFLYILVFVVYIGQLLGGCTMLSPKAKYVHQYSVRRQLLACMT